jgi:hypothetical protein
MLIDVKESIDRNEHVFGAYPDEYLDEKVI